MSRQKDLDRFYNLLNTLKARVSETRKLKDCTGYMNWPDRGVYFFLEPGETRDSTDHLRVTRVGTHAVSEGSSTSLWDRLKQHYGTGSGSSDHPHGGNHRGSVYRKRVGDEGKFVNRSDAIRASIRKMLDILDEIDEHHGRLDED